MKYMTSAEIRQAFLDFFQEQAHAIVPSSSLIPANDPTLLFTNAGMVQFKDVFLGEDKRPYTRATTAQRCVRAGGKHNDLENVGYTARHHTFFEMLGNFSFGDYFKQEAIRFAWAFLTERLGLPQEKLWVTVHHSDSEAERIWKEEIGVDPERFSKLDEDNFWAMGETGPCGPCTEIFYDHGESIFGGPPGSPDEDGDRYIEIWNVVFMQYNRSIEGEMTPLPRPSVDTGMGLERIAAVMQGVHSNYEIDLFQKLLAAAASAVGLSNESQAVEVAEEGDKSLRVIADHIRSCAFLVADGVMPSNEGRGYVLRRIVRRAVRHGNKLGAKGSFFHKLVAALVEVMGDAYPELASQQKQVEKTLLKEEEQFAKTLEHGMKLLNESMTALGGSEIPGEMIFKLYDTYGFPVDLTADVAREKGLTLDMSGFEAAMEAQRQRARASGSFAVDYNDKLELDGETAFTGYQALESSSHVIALFKEGEAVQQLNAEDNGIVVLADTPFYGESGGQVGDTGCLSSQSGRFTVTDCTKEAKSHLHHGQVSSGVVRVGDELTAQVDASKRHAIALNHSATHLLHAVLRSVLGGHVQQKGSLVNAERLRFDFAHPEAVTAEQLHQIEQLVNEQILANTPIITEIMSIADARQKGAMALFGEKYDDEVRVLSMGGDFSIELCGGTHAVRTGDIGSLKIVSESGIASGVRRMEAVTGLGALAYADDLDKNLLEIAALVKSGRDQLVDKVKHLTERNRHLEKELEQLKSQLASAKSGDIAASAVEIKAGIKLIAAQLDELDPKALRDTIDQLKNKLGTGVVVLASVNADKISLAAGVTKDITDKVKAGDLVRELTTRLGGKGGGRADFAQGGGSDIAALPEVLDSVKAYLEKSV